MGWKHMGPELENSTFLKGNWNAMLSKSEVEACDRGEAAARAAVKPFLETCFFFFLDEITVRSRKKEAVEVCVKMRGNNCSWLIIGVINVLIIR